MTRFLVISDTHGQYLKLMRNIDYLSQLGADALIHLGDFAADGTYLARNLHLPLHSVSGNCDGRGSDAPDIDLLESDGVRVFLCHGHTLNVKSNLLDLYYAAQERACSVALFGHTHTPYLEQEGGILLLNPGAIYSPKLSDPSIALLTLDKGQAKAILLPCKG